MAITVKNKPTLNVPRIEFPIQPSLKEQTQLMAARFGYTPVAYYQGLPIEEGSIVYFKLESTEWLPKLTITIKDWSSQMKSKLFALDNQNITIFINSRENGLRDILMDFKIITYDYDQKQDLIFITGWPNVNDLYVEKNVSYPQMTSFETLEKIAQSYKIGFATNITNTNDRMTWINPGNIAEEFIIRTVHRSYLNDDAFMWSFLDIYYNLNFIDIETEMSQDASKQVGIVSFGGIGTENEKSKNPVEIVLFYGKRIEGNATNMDIIDYEVYNQSTFQSLAQGYRKNIEYYDRSGNWNKGRAGQFVQFTMETNQNSQAAAENIILKDLPSVKTQDTDSFFKKNTKIHWLGKFDISNVHINYNYTIQHNRFNLEELQKMYIVVTLAVPNYNLRRFTKVKILIDDVATLDTNNALNERISGAWLIVGIIFEKINGNFSQQLILVRRELTANNFDI